MDDGELYDLENEIGEVRSQVGSVDTDQRIALLNVEALVALGYQVNRLGVLVEELTEPGPSRWQRVKGWLR